jgi:predicted nuclease with TOPRIM domain
LQLAPSGHSSNHSGNSPKSVYERDEDEVLIKDRLEQLEEMNQISQIKANELNEVKELLEQKTIEYDALLEYVRDLEGKLQESNGRIKDLGNKLENLIL